MLEEGIPGELVGIHTQVADSHGLLVVGRRQVGGGPLVVDSAVEGDTGVEEGIGVGEGTEAGVGSLGEGIPEEGNLVVVGNLVVDMQEVHCHEGHPHHDHLEHH